ncbi:uncharacterized protein L969DRAFT_626659 [Mixia osmundae IAM 14324]|uniref:Plasma membrane fusion protein PRM1 n=1 Tax=Mixia osmundae (strain CBS 9802 / IAM 14324 / JCM 22182 / KY 12970) TaxID=764103 RepID=G7E7H7_MIXOS|nr:uncharacterized protein L969DRAFT_626659 [Mixia osmundae IAM 14324]KEI38390.1 hypothetical protein L969DRAFT_626659 [Mixia osmundae IAM 14324]GAA98787.1 hypothetical protein E5Q_05475 [Mixia osmundae IAM 14324]
MGKEQQMAASRTRYPSSDDHLGPFLGKRARCVLTVTAYPVIVLLLILQKLWTSLAGVPSAVAAAKNDIAKSCASSERVASLLASAPHYTAQGVNTMLASGTEDLVHGLGDVLSLVVQGLQAIVLFIVDTYRSLYLCLISLTVHGAMDLAISATEEFSSLLNSTTAAIRTDIQDGVQDLDTAISAIVDKINLLPGVDFTAPSFDVPQLTSLENVTVPSDFWNRLISLNDSLPTLDDLKASLDDIISTPFIALRQDVNGTLGAFAFDQSVLPVPALDNVEYCSDLDLGFVDEIGKGVQNVMKEGIVACCLLALVIIGVLCLWECWRCDREIETIESAKEIWLKQQQMSKRFSLDSRQTSGDLLSTRSLRVFLHDAQFPLLHKSVLACEAKVPALRRSSSARDSLSWLLSFICHPTALLVLALGLVGLISIEIQIAMLNDFRGPATQQAAAGTAILTQNASTALEARLQDASTQYAASVNSVLQTTETSLNTHVFGWIDTTGLNLNTTLNTFYSDLTGIINTTFDGTIFADAALGVIGCLLGSKVNAIEEGLTFVYDHARVSLPTVQSDVLLPSGNTTASVASAASDDSDGFVDKLIDSSIESLKHERGACYLFIAIWLALLFGALLVILVTHARQTKRDACQPKYASSHASSQITLVSNAASLARTVSAPRIVPVLSRLSCHPRWCDQSSPAESQHAPATFWDQQSEITTISLPPLPVPLTSHGRSWSGMSFLSR